MEGRFAGYRVPTHAGQALGEAGVGGCRAGLQGMLVGICARRAGTGGGRYERLRGLACRTFVGICVRSAGTWGSRCEGLRGLACRAYYRVSAHVGQAPGAAGVRGCKAGLQGICGYLCWRGRSRGRRV